MKRLLTLLIVLAASPAFSQGFEISLVGGYTTPGGIDQKALGIQDLAARGQLHLGASAGLLLLRALRRRSLVGSRGSGLEDRHGAGQRRDRSTSTSTRCRGASCYQLGSEQSGLRPFFTAGAGASFFSAPDLDGETKLSFGGRRRASSGVPAKKVGAKLQARYTPTHLNDSVLRFLRPVRLLPGAGCTSSS